MTVSAKVYGHRQPIVGQLDEWNEAAIRIDGRWYMGPFAFTVLTAAIERMVADVEAYVAGAAS